VRRALPAGAAALLCALAVCAQGEEAPRRILVTSLPAGEPLTAAELEIRIGNKPAEILRVYQAEERPVQLALLIAENAGGGFTSNLAEVRRFLDQLPEGSQVLVAYLQSGVVKVEQPFTADRGAAAGAVRLPASSSGPSDLGVLIWEALRSFPEEPEGRAQILYLGEGTAPEEGLYNDARLDRAIRQAQERGVVVWTLHVEARALGLDAGHVELGEAYLKRLATETGGKAFALGVHAPSLEPYLNELRGLLQRQYLVEFIPPAGGKGKLEVRVRGQRGGLLHPER